MEFLHKMYSITPNPGSTYVWNLPGNIGHLVQSSDGNLALVKFLKDTSIVSLKLTQFYQNACPLIRTENLVVNPFGRLVYPDSIHSACDTAQIRVSKIINTTGYTFQWLPADGLLYPTSMQPLLVGKQSRTYKLIYSKGNCSDSAFVKYNYTTCPTSLVYVNNTFSPNGTPGQNDFLEVYGLDDCDMAKMEIFNRWGKLVFSQSPYTNNWNGNDLPPGANYYYVFTYTIKGQTETNIKTGSIQLMRE